MSKNVQRLECCSVLNEATTHQLTADNWFMEREIDFAVCRKCGANLLQKRFLSVNGEYINPPTMKGRKKVWNKYQELLKYEVGEIDNDYLRAVGHTGGLMQNVYYSVGGIVFRTDHIRTGRKWDGEKFLKKINNKYQ